MWKAASTAALILAAALVAGCGGSSAKSPAAGDTTTTAARPAANADFSALLNNLGKQSFKVTFTDASGNTQTYAQDGTGNTVTINGDVQVYTSPTAAITCEKSDTGAFTCTQAPASLGANSTYIAFAVAERTYALALAYRLAHTSGKTIAGREASCFSVSAPDFRGVKGVAGAAGARLSGAAAYCNDSDTGALLESTFTDDSGDMTTNLSVTKVEEPSAADFQPPATPTIVTIPGGPVTVPGGVGAQ
jgi:hypothetical protein